jgi:hypothetical protein
LQALGDHPLWMRSAAWRFCATVRPVVARSCVRHLAILVVVASGCGHPRDSSDPGRDSGVASDDSNGDNVDAADASATNDSSTSATADAGPDAFVFPSKLDLKINCRNDCVLIASPASIAVPAGTEFTVNWINTGDTECDVAKIDQFNQVPIIIGLEPGTSYHDSVREWCGAFTGTFNFRVSICTIHSYIPVDCDG